MYIVSGDALQIIDSACVERFVVAKKPDAVLVLASYGAERQPITIAKYESKQEAGDALQALLAALVGGQTHFYMPESRLFAAEYIKHDSRVKRKGGS